MHYLSACPVCQESDLIAFLSCKDHTVSHETFRLQQCARCGFVMTNPRPDDKSLPRYYHSEAYISHSDKSLNLIDQVYKMSRRFTLKWKYNLIQKHSLQKPSTILDYGCGTGAFLQECKKRKMNISGVEPSPLAREQAKKNTNTEISSDAAELGRDFDVITLWHVLEHVTDFHETLSKLKINLNESGTMFIAVPNLRSLDAQKYQEHWAGYDVPRHLWHFSKNTMERVLNRHQLKSIKVIPMPLDSYYVSLLSEKYKNGNNSVLKMAKAVHNGWSSNRAAKKTREYSSLIYIVRK